MKKLAQTLLPIMILLASSFPCFAADSEASSTGSVTPEIIAIGDDEESSASIAFLTTIVDLNTGAEYHATTGNPAIIEAEIGHQYSVSATANISGTNEIIESTTRFSIGENGLTVNCSFSDNGGVIIHAYSFIMPDDTQLSYVEDSLISNGNVPLLKPKWESAISSKGIITRAYYDHPLNDSFILEVTDKTAPPIDKRAQFGIIFLMALAGGIGYFYGRTHG